MITIQPKGFKELRVKLEKLKTSSRTELAGIMYSAANTFVTNAKKDAPINFGVLRNEITYFRDSPLSFKVTSGAKYSAYVEFGTKGKVNIPSEWSEYASQFKGKGDGDYYDFLNAILNWVKQKGIGMSTLAETNEVRARFGQKRITKKDRLVDVAERIAWSIIRKGLAPHPFFFKQSGPVQAQLETDIQNFLNSVDI